MASEEEPESPLIGPSSTLEDLFHIYDNYIRHVWEGLQRQQQDGEFCFLLLQTYNPKESRSNIRKPHIVAHACIFANFCSKFFNVANYDDTGNYCLNLKDFTRETILTALAFLYTGIVKCSSQVLPDLRRLARHLGMEEMLNICNKLLQKQKAIIAIEKRKLEQKHMTDKFKSDHSQEAATDAHRFPSTSESPSIKEEIPSFEPDSKELHTDRDISFIDDLYQIYDDFVQCMWKGLCLQQQQRHFCNLIISIGKNSPTFHVHAALFAIFSTRFADLAKLDEETGKYHLNLKPYSKEVVITLLGFFYTGVIKCSYQIVPELLELSYHLGVKESEYACEDYLKVADQTSFGSNETFALAGNMLQASPSKRVSYASPSEYINKYLRIILGLHNDRLTSSIYPLENNYFSSSAVASSLSTPVPNKIRASSISVQSEDVEQPLKLKRNDKFPMLSSYLQHPKKELVRSSKDAKSTEFPIGLEQKVLPEASKTSSNSIDMPFLASTVDEQLQKKISHSKKNSENISNKQNISDLQIVDEQKLPIKQSANARKISIQNRKKIYRDVIYLNKEGNQMKGKKFTCYTDSLPLSKRKAARPQKLTKINNDTNTESNADHLPDNCEGSFRRKRRAVQCPKCPRSFADEKALLKHLNSHEQGEIHKCHVCGMNYARLCDYTRHVRVHTAENQYTCRYCNKVCQTQRDFIEHNSNEHQDNRPFKCDAPACTFQAAKLAYLTDHRHIHSDVKGFSCSKCERTFSQAGGLHSHVKSCYQMQGYLCDLCGQTFNHLGSMKSHRRIHLGEKPHACTDCGAKFSDHRNLRRHRRIHENSFPYPCTHCDKRFRHSNSLKAHLRHHGINVGATSVTVLIQGTGDCNYLDSDAFPMCHSPATSEFSQNPASDS